MSNLNRPCCFEKLTDNETPSPAAAGTGSGKATLIRKDFRIYQKNDGWDYLDILERFIRGEIKAVLLDNHCQEREVYHVSHNGRDYTLKVDREIDRRLEKRFWRRLSGSAYLKLMRQVNRAVSQGCSFIQDIYLVAEKRRGRGDREEVYLLAEYIPGQPLQQAPDPEPYYPMLAKTITRLHEYNLASNDIHPGNFVITDDGLKIIDLSNSGLTLIGKAKDLLALKKQFGLHLRPSALVERLALNLVSLWERFRRFRHNLKEGQHDPRL